MKIIINTIAILTGVLLLSSCHQNQEFQSPVAATQLKKVTAPETAMETARAYLDANKADLSRHEMSKPDGIQEIQIQGQKAWRVSWRLKKFTGKGGQLIVIVTESGKCEQGWGE